MAEHIAGTSKPDKVMTILYALGWTQHSVGSQNIRCMAMIQLLLGQHGSPRRRRERAARARERAGHHRHVRATPKCCRDTSARRRDSDPTREVYLSKRTPKQALRPNQMAFTINLPKWHTSLMKAWYGNAATKENDFAYDWLPKKDAAYDVLHMFELMFQGKMNGFICQGFNPLAALPNKKKVSVGFAKLKYLVVMDPLETETAEFWKNFGPLNDVDPAQIKTEVFRLPTSRFAEETGSFTNSSRVLQWKEPRPGPAGRRQGGLRDHGAAVREDPRAVQEGGRQAPRADPST